MASPICSVSASSERPKGKGLVDFMAATLGRFSFSACNPCRLHATLRNVGPAVSVSRTARRRIGNPTRVSAGPTEEYDLLGGVLSTDLLRDLDRVLSVPVPEALSHSAYTTPPPPREVAGEGIVQSTPHKLTIEEMQDGLEFLTLRSAGWSSSRAAAQHTSPSSRSTEEEDCLTYR